MNQVTDQTYVTYEKKKLTKMEKIREHMNSLAHLVKQLRWKCSGRATGFRALACWVSRVRAGAMDFRDAITDCYNRYCDHGFFERKFPARTKRGKEKPMTKIGSGS
ncbi:MAG: hypothetical protein ACYTEX_21040 [Planctomycetota bacterium]|jgi:hypothetical protein